MKNKKDKESLFNLHVVTPEDERKRYDELIQNLTEEQKSDWNYHGENFYYLGRGHAFLFGFFSEFVTKSGIKAWRYDSGKWVIDGHDFTYNKETDEFELVPQPKVDNENIDWQNIQFPVVKNVNAKTIGSELKSYKPKVYK